MRSERACCIIALGNHLLRARPVLLLLLDVRQLLSARVLGGHVGAVVDGCSGKLAHLERRKRESESLCVCVCVLGV